MSYTVRVFTEDAGVFLIKTEAASLQEAESVARQAVRYQFSNLILNSQAYLTHEYLNLNNTPHRPDRLQS